MYLRLANTLILTLSLFAGNICGEAMGEDTSEVPLSLIVMDPLAAPLSCPCVEGYAQREYGVLAKYLEDTLGRKVQLTFAESLAAGLKKAGGTVEVVIGKDSVVRADAKVASIDLTVLGHLTDKQGSTQQYGVIVVNRDDPAMQVSDLNGYTIIFGPTEAEEKHSEAVKLLRQAHITVPQTLAIDAACSDGACKVIDLGPMSRTAAVISSYAQPLLEGCGTIKKGDLRVVGKTAPVPFITAFGVSQTNEVERQQLQAALLNVTTQPTVLSAMESLVGFLPAAKAKPAVAATASKKK